MTKEQRLLLKLLAHSITGKSFKCEEDIDWLALIKESIAQTVSIIAFDSATVLKDKIPKEIYTSWFNHTYGSMAINSLVEKSQKELTEILGGRNYPYVILKGLSAAAYYEKPELRSLGDVDFLIENNKKNEIKELLKENGYDSSNENHICHIVFTKPKAHLEMHFEIAGIPEGEKGDIIRKYMVDALEKSEIKNISGQAFSSPSPYHHAIILLLHMQHHILGEGIGLRHLMDWACFVNKTYDMPFWEEKVLPLLKEIGLFEFANVFTNLSVKYFGINSPVWIKEADEELLKELIEDILSGGNFGKKDKKRGKSGMMISDRGKSGTKKGKLYYINKTLVDTTYTLYPISKKHKILLPFINFYRIVRYFILRLFGKRTSLLSAIPLAEKRKALYSHLHIFEVKDYE